MIVIVAELSVAAEDRAVLIDAARRMRETTISEDGCRQYEFFENVFQPNQFSFVEEWEDAEALRHHSGTADMSTFRQRTDAIIVDRKTSIHEVASTRRT